MKVYVLEIPDDYAHLNKFKEIMSDFIVREYQTEGTTSKADDPWYGMKPVPTTKRIKKKKQLPPSGVTRGEPGGPKVGKFDITAEGFKE